MAVDPAVPVVAHRERGRGASAALPPRAAGPPRRRPARAPSPRAAAVRAPAAPRRRGGGPREQVILGPHRVDVDQVGREGVHRLEITWAWSRVIPASVRAMSTAGWAAASRRANLADGWTAAGRCGSRGGASWRGRPRRRRPRPRLQRPGGAGELQLGDLGEPGHLDQGLLGLAASIDHTGRSASRRSSRRARRPSPPPGAPSTACAATDPLKQCPLRLLAGRGGAVTGLRCGQFPAQNKVRDGCPTLAGLRLPYPRPRCRLPEAVR